MSAEKSSNRNQRIEILSRIRAQLGRGPLIHTEEQRLQKRIEAWNLHTLNSADESSTQSFIQKLLARGVECFEADEIKKLSDILKEAACAYENPQIVIAQELKGRSFDLPDNSRVRFGPGTISDQISVSCAVLGVVETGSLLVASKVDSPVSLALVPEIHVLVLDRKQIFMTLEDAWAYVRKNISPLPRSMHFITGPSMTGDIAATLVKGAHGPKQLKVFITG